VAIYGAGTFGQHLVRQIQDSGTVDQVAWVDPLCSNYNKLGLKVEPPNSLQNKVYDYVLVAFVDELIANKVVMKLSAMDISSSKIVTINYGSDFNRRLLGLWCFDQVRLTLV
jgi:pyrroline-5-carboxylate reductase